MYTLNTAYNIQTQKCIPEGETGALDSRRVSLSNSEKIKKPL